MVTNLLAATALLLRVAALADQTDVAAVSSLKVDVAKVVEVGQVEAVDGVTSAGQPDKAALTVFSDSGYVAVIDLRGMEEDRGLDEKAAVESLGMAYVPMPIVGRDEISFDNARRLGQLIDSYEGPVLIHCGSGNRVGALLALRASLEGVDDQSAIEIGKKGGLSGLEDLVRERLEAD